MNAIQCDKCKELVPVPDSKLPEYWGQVAYGGNKKFGPESHTLDLCPSCYAQFQEFIETEPPKVA